VQSFSSSAQVKAGDVASFVVWVWSTKAESTGVTLKASVVSASYVGRPSFKVCPVPDGTTCQVGNLPVGQSDELEATVRVGSKAALGEHVRISAKAAAKGAKDFSASASDLVVAAPTGTSSAPTVTLPPPDSLPAISGTSVSPTNPSGLFPTVSASPSSGTNPLGLPHAKTRPGAADAAATVPLDARLIGGQLAGLAVLAGAVAIAIVRLSLRTAKPQDGPGSSQAASDGQDPAPKE
jgi:hypothetical protein